MSSNFMENGSIIDRLSSELGPEDYENLFSDLNPEKKIFKKGNPIYFVEHQFIFPDGTIVDEDEILDHEF